MIENFVQYAIQFNLILLACVFLISRAYPVLSYLGRLNQNRELTIEEDQTKKHRVSILVFGTASFGVGLGISFILSGMLIWDLFERPATDHEVYLELGDNGTGYMAVMFIALFPIVAEAIGLLVYGIGYLYARWRNYRPGFRKYWLLYPILSITIVAILYSVFYLYPFFSLISLTNLLHNRIIFFRVVIRSSFTKTNLGRKLQNPQISPL